MSVYKLVFVKERVSEPLEMEVLPSQDPMWTLFRKALQPL